MRQEKELFTHQDTLAKAFAVLRQMSNSKLDRDCVEALINHVDKVLEIQQRFRDDDLI